MVTSVDKWKRNYEQGAAGAGSKLVENYTSTSNKLAKATSPEAQKNYEEAMRDPKVLARRQSKLRKMSEDDLNKAMEAKGAAAYAAGVSAASDKAANAVQPYLAEIDRVTASMKPRTRDPMANVDNRVKPLVKALAEKKQQMG